MDNDQFFTEFREMVTSGLYRRHDTIERIRFSHPKVHRCMCPIEAVYHYRTGALLYATAAAAHLGLHPLFTKTIIYSADNEDCYDQFNPHIRERLNK